VENALKVAFDWKSRQNEAAGRSRDIGTRILHFTHAFHGRSGYTLSLTNTEPVKTDRFPKFDWPRIDVPAITFPLAVHLDEVIAAEHRALEQARSAFAAFPHDIAAFIAEPIQGEGGDNHIRPEFFAALQQIVHDNDALFIFDEVQTGVGTTGTPWAYQQLGVQPDIVAFAKKAQLGGIMAGGRVDEVPDNVFAVSGRINSTWGGGLTDMVRSRRILEIIESEGLIEEAGPKGVRLMTGLAGVQERTSMISNVRGRGLFVAFDLPTPELRNSAVSRLRKAERVIVLPCGDRSIRLRPALSISHDEIDEAVDAIGRATLKVSTMGATS
jgi:L-lysine 6-transaminase